MIKIIAGGILLTFLVIGSLAIELRVSQEAIQDLFDYMDIKLND